MRRVPRLARAAALIAVVFAVVAASGVGPQVACALDNVSASNVFTLPAPDTQKWYGSSCGDVVVWGEHSGIWGYDLTQKRLFHLPVDTDLGTPNRPRISPGWIVYQVFEDVSCDQHIYAYDRSTEATFAVTSERGSQGNWERGTQGNYEISGDTVVWVAPDQSADSDIFGKNLATGESFSVTTAPGSQGGPDIAGDWVVYTTDSAAHGRDVMAYNIKTKTTRTLCGWSADQYNPKISDTGFVVWSNTSDPRDPNATSDLYGCYVTGGAIRKIAGGPGAQHNQSIGGNLIVYLDAARPGGYSLIGYDMLSATRFGISKDVGTVYYIQGIENGTIARIYTPERSPYHSTVQIVCPTELDVISDGSAADESVDVGDRGLLPEPPAEAAWLARIAVSSAASRVSTVVVGSASDWADTAIACSLAGRQSPVLFTGATTVSTAVLAKLASLAPRHVVVVGGASSVSDAAVRQLQSVVGTEAVTRFAGSDPKTRSLAAAEVIAARAGWSGTVLVASRDSASSGLIAIPASVWKGLPLILADSKGLSTAQIARLKAVGAKRFVVVGSAVPATTVSRLKTAVGATNVRLIVSTSAASTSAKFAAWATTSCGMTWDRACIASSWTWSHSLAAALAQGRSRSVLLLSDPTCLSASVRDALITHHRTIRVVNFAGKKEIVTTAVRRQVRLALK